MSDELTLDVHSDLTRGWWPNEDVSLERGKGGKRARVWFSEENQGLDAWMGRIGMGKLMLSFLGTLACQRKRETEERATAKREKKWTSSAERETRPLLPIPRLERGRER